MLFQVWPKCFKSGSKAIKKIPYMEIVPLKPLTLMLKIGKSQDSSSQQADPYTGFKSWKKYFITEFAIFPEGLLKEKVNEIKLWELCTIV